MIMIGKIYYTVNNENVSRTITRALKINDQSSIKNTMETLVKALKLCVRMDCENQKTTILYIEYDIIREIDPKFSDFVEVKTC